MSYPPANYKSASDRQRGRPREFDPDEVLDRAIRVFSARGFHGASIGDLTQAMGLAQGSIYKAFGDKKGVFLASFERYQCVRLARLQQTAGVEGSALDKLRRVLGFYVDSSTGDEGLLGCLTVSSAASLSALEPDMAEYVVTALGRNEIYLRELLRAGKADGSIPPHVDPAATAQMLVCLIQGMRVVGKAGRTREKLQSAVDAALKSVS